ncbi:hypothetical protein DPEC_G00036610 [Dallia pectoralis]|uniref:Uncharacterized protein n=1 Tax=Dallia pectoralis TaxID=75939 RepID=A0ACC2HDP8_DALPE|nr:hypothetical protein DPEC_G00036610 [Dallia pectoralis]
MRENNEDAQADMDQTVIGIYVMKTQSLDVDQSPEDVGIIVEGVQVLQELEDFGQACALLFGVIYVLNLISVKS